MKESPSISDAQILSRHLRTAFALTWTGTAVVVVALVPVIPDFSDGRFVLFCLGVTSFVLGRMLFRATTAAGEISRDPRVRATCIGEHSRLLTTQWARSLLPKRPAMQLEFATAYRLTFFQTAAVLVFVLYLVFPKQQSLDALAPVGTEAQLTDDISSVPMSNSSSSQLASSRRTLTCARQIMVELENLARVRGLAFMARTESDTSFDVRLIPEVQTRDIPARLDVALQQFEAECILFDTKYRDNQKMKSALRSYLSRIALSPGLVRADEMRQMGFSPDDTSHLQEHLSRFIRHDVRLRRDDSRYSGIDFIAARYDTNQTPHFSLDVHPSSANFTPTSFQSTVIQELRVTGSRDCRE